MILAYTLKPFSARVKEVSKPIPLELPVTTAILCPVVLALVSHIQFYM
jgi:hypothetical protein